MNDVILTAHEIYKIYRNGSREIRAVDGISLQIERTKSFAIVGPSGAGKSTLLHLLGGLDNPTRGKVAFDGRDLYALSDSERARIRNRSVGFVFQFYHLLPEFTALENVMLPAMIMGFGFRDSGIGVKKIRERAENILKSVGLGDRLHHKPNELSGGEAQRVAIARALINEPALLLCDEPTGNLDSKTGEMVFGLLLELKIKKDMTLIVATHDKGISSRLDQSIYIRDGRAA